MGREHELERIDAALDALDGGSAGCVAIEGEPGIGKSRLLAELRERAEAARAHRPPRPGGRVRARPPLRRPGRDGRPLPQRPARRRPRRRARSSCARSWRRSSRRCAAPGECAGRDRRRALPQPPRRPRPASSCSPSEKPLVIALDDLHWADEATIELLGALLRRPPDAPVLLILAFRPGSAPPRLLAALAAPLASKLELGQLSEAEAAALLGGRRRRVAARRSTATAAATPSTWSSWRGSSSRCASTRAGPRPSRGGVPAGVAASLAEEVADALRRCRAPCSRPRRSPASPSTPASPARSPSSTRPPRSSALDELLERELVRPTDVPRRFIFRHPLVRRSVYESIGGGSRLAAHSRAAGSLAARGAAAAERAHHVEQAAGQGDAEAIEVLLEAAAAAAGQGAGGRRALAGRRPAAAARRRPRAPDLGPGRARLGAALDRRARALPRGPARDDRAGRRRRRAAAAAADRLVRGGRALAGPPRGRPPAPDPRLGGARRPRHRRRAWRCRSSWRSTASTRSTSSRR